MDIFYLLERARVRRLVNRIAGLVGGLIVLFGIFAPLAVAQSDAALSEIGSSVQLMQPTGAGQSAPVNTVTLHDAIERAQKNDAQLLSAISDAKIAGEDRVQARAALLPSVNGSVQYLGTQGNGITPNGRYVTNDGVHVYRAWGVVHQDLSPGTFMATGYRRAAAAEALAKAKSEIARRGLAVTVAKDFYGLVVAQRKYATAQLAVEQAKHFFDITQDGERAGQSPHSDAIKAEIQYRLQQQTFDESKLAMEDARLTLAVLMFPTLNENFSVVDDLDSAQPLPQFDEVKTMAEKENPDLRVALEFAREAELDVSAAKTSFLPKLTLETDYGIEANSFALHSVSAAFPKEGNLPNLGYFVTAAVTIPVWDWGTLRSKLHQAEYKQQQAKAQLSQAQRQLVGNLYAAYNEAATARSAVESSRRTAELAAESVRLINLRYRGGESGVLEVVDASTTLVTARNAYDDAQARYRTALANLQTLTGNF
jgi:outer membrane protein TolC